MVFLNTLTNPLLKVFFNTLVIESVVDGFLEYSLTNLLLMGFLNTLANPLIEVYF